MKIDCIYGETYWNSWVFSQGVAEVLVRMGHDVHFRVVNHRPGTFSFSRKSEVPARKDAELALVVAAEWMPEVGWQKDYTCPVALWLGGGGHRKDGVSFASTYEQFLKDTPFGFFPSAQDAKEFGGTWLPYGVDTEMFKPMPEVEKSWDVVTCGHIYNDERRAFLQSLKNMGLNIPHVDTGRDDLRTCRENNEELAKLYNRAYAVISMPTIEYVYPGRVLEVMACGVAVLVPHDPYKNILQFKEAVPLHYDEQNLETLKSLLLCKEELRKNAVVCLEEARKHHKLEFRLEKILEVVFGTRT
jgi:hypothetical protein